MRRTRGGYVNLLPDKNYALIHPLAVNTVATLLHVEESDLNAIIIGGKSIRWEPDNEAGVVIIHGQLYKVIIEETKEDHLLTKMDTSSTSLFRLLTYVDIEKTCEFHEKNSGEDPESPWGTSANILRRFITEGLQLRDLFVTVLFMMPPDLRPILFTGVNTLIIDRKNEHYRRIVDKRYKLLFMNDVEWIKGDKYPVEFKKRFLRDHVISAQKYLSEWLLLGSFWRRKGVEIPSLMEDFLGKEGHIRNKMMGKRVDYSGRSVITPGPHLSINDVGLPKKMAYRLFEPWLLYVLEQEYGLRTQEAAQLYIRHEPVVYKILEELVKDKVVILNRQPSLHRMSMFCFNIRLHDGHSILLHPMVCSPFNADFDGDQMAVHVPGSEEALAETKRLMYPVDNLISPADGSPVILPSHEMVIGAYDMTNTKEGKPYVCLSQEKAIEAYDRGLISLNDPVTVRTPARFRSEVSGEESGITETCVGRIIIGDLFGVHISASLTKKSLKSVISAAYDVLGKERLTVALDQFKVLVYKHVSMMGFSLGIDDFVLPSTREARMTEAREFATTLATEHKEGKITEEERIERKVRKWMETIELLQKDFITEAGENNPLVIMLKTGARVSMTQVSQLVVAKGMQAKSDGGIIEDPIENCMRTKLSTFEFFVSCYGARKSMADKKMATPLSGYLARRLVNAARDLYISEQDCGYYGEGVEIERRYTLGRTSVTGEYFSEPSTSSEYVTVRSPIFCRAYNGICATCYGLDFSKRVRVAVETPVGVIAAQSLTEPCTQLTMRTFHTSGAAELKDSPLVIRAANAGEIYLERDGEHLIKIYVDKDYYLVHKKQARILVDEEDRVETGTPLAVYMSKSLVNEDIGGKLALLELYYESRSLHRHAAIVAKESGVVSFGADDDGETLVVSVNGKEQGSTNDTPIFVHSGEIVRKGQFLSYGEASLGELSENISCAANVFVQRMQYLYEQEGITLAPVHLEMIFRSMSELVENKKGERGLLRMGEPGERLLLGVTTLGRLYPSWLKAVSFGYTKEVLTDAVNTCAVSRDLPSERIMTGEYPLFQLKENNNG